MTTASSTLTTPGWRKLLARRAVFAEAMRTGSISARARAAARVRLPAVTLASSELAAAREATGRLGRLIREERWRRTGAALVLPPRRVVAPTPKAILIAAEALSRRLTFAAAGILLALGTVTVLPNDVLRQEGGGGLASSFAAPAAQPVIKRVAGITSPLFRATPVPVAIATPEPQPVAAAAPQGPPTTGGGSSGVGSGVGSGGGSGGGTGRGAVPAPPRAPAPTPAPTAAPTPPPSNFMVVAFQFVDKSTGANVPNVCVEAGQGCTSIQFAFRSDSSGFFNHAFPINTYDFTFFVSGYAVSNRRVTPADGSQLLIVQLTKN